MKRSWFGKTRIVSGLAELYSPVHYTGPMHYTAPFFIWTVTVGHGISPGRLPPRLWGRLRALPLVGTFTPPSRSDLLLRWAISCSMWLLRNLPWEDVHR